MDSQQRLCIHNNVVLGFKQVHEWMESVQDVRSVLCFGKQQYPIVLHLPFRLLKVLDVLAIRFYEFPYQVLDLLELTYFAITCDDKELPPSISRLQNLEVFIFRPYHDIMEPCVHYLPIEIWKLSKLKHLHCMGFDLPDPSSLDEDSLILGRLLTLVGVSSHSCTPQVLARMPRLEKIATKINTVQTGVVMLGDFTSLNNKFHSLKCDVLYPNLVKSQVIPSFPKYVTKITLSGCGFPWEYATAIGALSNLKVLKLQCHAFWGPEWKMSDVEKKQFPSLQYLVLEDLDIEHWVINDDHHIILRCLIIKHCYKLQKIPKRLLRSDGIELECCSLSLVKQIQDRPRSYKHTDVRITSVWDADKN